MRKWMLCCVVAMFLSLNAARGAAPDLKETTRTFLDAYASGERATALAMADPGITFYGSDVAEVFHGRDALASMMTNDQRLWGGHASIGEMKEVSVMQGGALAVIFFQADFTMSGRPAVPVRFAMTWRLTGDRWLLVQSSNAVPTKGQSAAELLGQK